MPRTWPLRTSLATAAVGLVAIFSCALCGFGGPLHRDAAKHVYAGQQMVRGVPPYVSIFNHVGPLSPMLCGAAIAGGRIPGVDDVVAVRLVFTAVAILAAIVLVAVGRHLTRTSAGAAAAGLTLLCFGRFLLEAASGPDKKVLLILLEALFLLSVAHRRWFLAGMWGSLAVLVWQGALVLPLVAVGLVAFEPRSGRGRSLLLVAAGTGLPLLLVTAYFAANRALNHFFDGLILANILYLEPGQRGVVPQVVHIATQAWRGYPGSVWLLAAGLAAILATGLTRISHQVPTAAGDALHPAAFSRFGVLNVLVSTPPRPLRRKHHRAQHLAALATKPGETCGLKARSRCAAPPPVLAQASAACALGFLAVSMVDFQGPPDLFPFLPLASLGVGLTVSHTLEQSRGASGPRAVLVPMLVVTLAATALTAGLSQRRDNLATQRRTLERLFREVGEPQRLLVIGEPAALVLSRRTNPTRFVSVYRGIDHFIDDHVPGGFSGWVASLARHRPDLVIVGPVGGPLTVHLHEWYRRDLRSYPGAPWNALVQRSSPVRPRPQGARLGPVYSPP